jgi:hypothetical protein
MDRLAVNVNPAMVIESPAAIPVAKVAVAEPAAENTPVATVKFETDANVAVEFVTVPVTGG